MSMNQSKTIILGGGMMGLCAAEELSRRGHKNLLVLEQENETGGICRGVKVREEIFDFGPHGFWTQYQSSFDYCQRICGDDLLDLGLKEVSIHFRGKEYPYPLKIGETLRRLPLNESIMCMLSFAKVYLRNLILPPKCDSFETYIQNYFGKGLYNIFFRGYTQKVWGISPTKLAASFAAERIPKITLRKMIRDFYRRVFKASKTKKSMGKYDMSHMYYPKFGFRGFVKQLTETSERRGVAIECGAEVTAIETDGGKARAVRFRTGGVEKRVECDQIISTLPIDVLSKMLSGPSVPITFRKISFVFLVVKRPRVYNHQWVYYQDPDIYMHRVYETKAFGQFVSPKSDETGICVEITNRDNLSAEALTNRVLADFERLGVFAPKEVIASQVIEVEHGYPLYDLNYKASLDTLIKHTAQFKNIITAGRQGLFIYVDTDHCMKMAEIIADHMFEGKPLDKLYSVVAAHG
jgi:protoporphyrinogen oxidase